MEILATLGTIIMLCSSMVTRPARARCPRGWHVEGSHLSGEFSCVRTAPRGVCDTKAGCDDQRPDPRIESRVYCTGGTLPIVGQDGASVGCQRWP